MARESQLWKRCRTASQALARHGHRIDIQRIENAATSGHPDVEGCIDGHQIWIELKSCDRPVRPATPIRPKKRPSQDIWHTARSRAGSKCHWILIQVGEDHDGRLYLIPGKDYAKITAPESELAIMSGIAANATVPDILLRAAAGW